MAPAQQPNEFPYADFLEQFMGNSTTGRGIDHSGPSSHPSHWPGFPFGRPPHPPPPPPGPPGHDHFRPPSPPAPPGHHGRHHPHHPHRPDQQWGWGGWGDRHGGGWDEADFDFSDRGHGRHGRGRRHHHHDNDEEEATRERPLGVSNDEKPDKSADENQATASGDDRHGSPDTMKADVPDPEEMVPEYEEARPNNNETFTGALGGFGHGYGWGGRGGRGGRGGCGRGYGRRHHHNHDRSGSHFPNPAAPPGGFSLPDMMRGFMSHPFLQHMGAAARSFQNPDSPSLDESTFSPPVDIFNTPAAYVLHVALPGAKRDDVGVHWDPERGALSVSGVVHRPGDEAFLQTMHSSERRVGVFARSVALPPRDAGEQQEGGPREEIDAEGIAAKLDDGVLVIMVPKMEKEWTEVRKVDIL
ncbi:HSP20-like chaperone [Cordyceps militaris CM01]|uniref:HSP20-like chaperone n=1 Tax=Cordyceps militaris (strain CM01) TaxID=983644 RepID=G3JJG9_CORMM|nr:HSP20-like chaperone [Cordyceps militaris CM01]EGX92057.1 HSP20-like chaperone [Cordyceps militaris CM01]